MKIVLFELDQFSESLFEPLRTHQELVITSLPLTQNNLEPYADAEVISTFNQSDTSEAILSCFPKLRHLAIRKTGFDDVPMDYCLRQGITVSTVPHYGRHTVAEHAFMLLLALSRRLLDEAGRIRQGDFTPKAPPGFDLHGKTIGVIGTGSIGRQTVQIAKGFGMKVIAHDICPDISLSEAFGFQYLSKEALIEQADIISLHVPADASTFHLIGAVELRRMKPGSVLVNTARGNVVDSLALLESLKSGHLGGACLDVYPHEEYLRQPDLDMPEAIRQEREVVLALLALPNVIATPHVGYNTKEAILRILTSAYDNIAHFIQESQRTPCPSP